jgi:hypothetical protein
MTLGRRLESSAAVGMVVGRLVMQCVAFMRASGLSIRPTTRLWP